MRDLRAAVTIPPSVGPLPLGQARGQRHHARIRLHPEPAAYEETISVHRGALSVAARDLERLPPGVEQPSQHAVDGARDSVVSVSETELDQAQQPPVRPLPLLIRMTGVFPKKCCQPGIHSYRLRHGTSPS